MKNRLAIWTGILLCISVLVSCASIPHRADADILRQLSFHGSLKTSGGSAVTDGSYDIVFKIYDAPSGGNLLWTGTHTAGNGNAVAVDNGFFSVLLGSGTGNDLDLSFNEDTYYLGVTVASDSEMTPRTRIGAAAFALNADKLDGYDASDFVRTDATSTIATSSSDTLLTLNQEGAGDVLNAQVNGSEVFTITQSGSVGVGTSSPGATLHINGPGAGNYDGYPALTMLETPDENTWSLLFRNNSLGSQYDSGFYIGPDGSLTISGTENNNALMSWLPGTVGFGTTTAYGDVYIRNQSNVPFFIADSLTDRIGIGTTSPLAKLSVAGDTYIGGSLTATGTITFPSLTSGLLYTNGSGILSASTTLGAAILDSGVLFATEIDTSSELAALLDNESGSGSLVFNTSPTISNITLSGVSTITNASTTNITISGALFDSLNSPGTNTFVLQSTGNGVQWVATTSLGLGNGSASATSGPAFSVHKNATDQGGVSTGGAGNLVTWSHEYFDTNNNFDLSTERFTPTVAGKYIVTAGALNTDPATNQFWQVSIAKNGTPVCSDRDTPANTYGDANSVSCLVDMNGSSDYLEVYVYSTGATTISGNAGYTNFSGALVTPVYATGGGWQNDGTRSFLADSTDLVGIGTTSASDKLHVYGGNIRVDNGSTGIISFWDGASLFGGVGTVSGFTGSGSNNDIALMADTSRGLHFYTNGVANERMIIASNGNVGIGTTSPAYKLDVTGLDGNTALTVAGDTNRLRIVPQAGQMYIDSVTAGQISPAALVINGNTLTLQTNNGSVNGLHIDTLGNIGLGTTSPVRKLDLANSAASTTVEAHFVNGTTGFTASDGFGVGYSTANSAYIWNYENTALRFATNNTEYMRLSNTGELGIGTTTPANKLSVVGGADTWTATFSGLSTSDTVRIGTLAGVATIGANNNSGNTWATLSINPGGNVSLASSSGNVGIGNPSPSEILDIALTQNATSSIKLRNADSGANASARLVLGNNLDPQDAFIQLNSSGNTRWGGARSLNIVGNANGIAFVNGYQNPTPSVVISNAGNFGIGTSTPDSKLQIMDTITGLSTGLKISPYHTIGVVAGTALQAVDADPSSYRVLSLNPSGGNVGIGTTTPDRKLVIDSGSSATGVYFGLGNNGTRWLIGSEVSPSVDILSFYDVNSTADRMVIDDNGNVGIGTTTPTSRLTIADSGATPYTVLGNLLGVFRDTIPTGQTVSLLSTDDSSASDEYFIAMASEMDSSQDNEFLFRTDGTALADGSWNGGGADYAEYVTPRPGTDPEDYPKGSLICVYIGAPDSYGFCDNANDSRVVGVISTFPAIVGNSPALAPNAVQREETHILLSMLGRVPVRVSLENGPIEIGDRLAASSLPGIAMRATDTARTVGFALEEYTNETGSNSIMMYIEPELTFADIELESTSELATFAAHESDAPLSPWMQDFMTGLFTPLTDWFANASNEIGDFFANRVRTKELCVADDSGETCLTRSELDALIIGADEIPAENSSGDDGGDSEPPIVETSPDEPEPPSSDEGLPPEEGGGTEEPLPESEGSEEEPAQETF